MSGNQGRTESLSGLSPVSLYLSRDDAPVMDGNMCEKRWRSYSSFGLFREEDETDRAPRWKNGRFRASFAFVAATLLILTAVFFILQASRPSKMSRMKAKRFAVEPGTPREDVSIVPDKHPNHRYREHQYDQYGMTESMAKDKIKVRSSEGIREPERDRKNWNNIQDIIHRIEVKEKLRKLMENKRPILFKGVYLKEKKKQDDEGADGRGTEEDEAGYFREINEMLEGGEPSPEGKRRKLYSDRASPFHPKDSGDESNDADVEMGKNSKKPITVMLDIYPVGDDARDRQKDVHVYVPIRPSLDHVASAGRNGGYVLAPYRGGKRFPPGRNRMFMRLNLYPKRSGDRVPMHRRTTAGFKGNDQGHACHLVEHKPVTVGVKDESGDWIKANYVTHKRRDRKLT